MPNIVTHRTLAAASGALFSMVLLALALASNGEAAGTRKEAMRPVVSASLAGRQPTAPQAQEQTSRRSGEARLHAAALPGRAVSGLARAPSCLPDRLKAALAQIEKRWGPVKIISAHRPGARIRGSGRPSLHASCRAVDFRPPRGTYRAVARWLKKSHAGGVGTYSGKHNHIHIDARRCELAKCYRWHN